MRKIEIQENDINGDSHGNEIFIIIFLHLAELENSLKQIWLAKDLEHLEALIKDHLFLLYDKGEYLSPEVPEASFEDQFENDWRFLILKHKIGVVIQE